MNLQDPHANAKLSASGVPLDEADAAVLLLHGRGGSAADILSLAPHLDPGPSPRLAFRALQATGNTWYPGSFLLPREQNEPHLSSALDAVNRSLDQLAETVPTSRIVVLGFSQGACLAAESVFRRPDPIGGLICLTGGLIGQTIEAANPEADFSGMPVLLTGGDPDPHVPWSRVEETAAAYRDRGASVETQRFPGKHHGVSQEEIRLASDILPRCLPS